jgi:hypothetical protein
MCLLFRLSFQMDILRENLEKTAHEITRTVNKYLSSLDACSAQHQLVQEASQSLRILQQQDWADKLSDNLSAISEVIAIEREKLMTAARQVESLRDNLLSLQETSKIAMEAMLNSYRKIDAAVSNGKACSHQDRKPFMFDSATATIVQELKDLAASDKITAKGLQPSTQYPYEYMLPSMSSTCLLNPSASLENNTEIENLVDGVNNACDRKVPSHDLRWDNFSKK